MSPEEIASLRELRAHADQMVAYYASSERKLAQNAAMVAAGLAPLHDQRSLERDRESAAKFRRWAAAADAALAILATSESEAA
jgi:hypothetical protein